MNPPPRLRFILRRFRLLIFAERAVAGLVQWTEEKEFLTTEL